MTFASYLSLVTLPFIAFFLINQSKASIQLLKAKAFVPVFARKLAKIIKSYDYTENEIYSLDQAPESIIEKRKSGMAYLQHSFETRYASSLSLSNEMKDSFSDLRFTDANRVPFQFAKFANKKLNVTSFVVESDGPYLKDIQGNVTLDISGSYGCNVAGYNFYKTCIEEGWNKVKLLGPVLGPVHPLVIENIQKLKKFSGLDEVSFHMSGTEAVMAAIRVARFNTKRKKIVLFSGAYHGWWDGVQPSLGSERPLPDCLLLKDLHPDSLKAIIACAADIAGVVINPIQSFHPNTSPPNDALLVTGDARITDHAYQQYKSWLHDIRRICTENNIPLIFDEVYTGFRLAAGGAQEYFDVKADMDIYGKTVAGGMPIGVVCGKKELMKRFDEKHPLKLAYVVGTFSAHPQIMGAMHVFLSWAELPETKKLYQQVNNRFAQWIADTNTKLQGFKLPIQLSNMGTVWTILFTQCSCYNWLLQYYLRAEGLTLSWVGSGRCLISFDFTEEHYQQLQDRLMQAAIRMKNDGWWWLDENNPLTNKQIKRRVAGEMLASLVPQGAREFVREINERKHHDHIASHSNLINQFLHFISSSMFIYAYCILFFQPVKATALGLLALLIRQAGHALLEPPCHDKEKLLLGFTTRSKTILVSALVLPPLAGALFSHYSLSEQIMLDAYYWLAISALAIGGNVFQIIRQYGFKISMIWFIKLITDPITDIFAYYSSIPKLYSLIFKRS